MEDLLHHKSFGKLHHGKRITIQATAAGRRRKGVKKGKAPVVSGRPAVSQSVNIADKHCMPVRNEPKGKRLHNLSANIANEQLNGKLIHSDCPFYILSRYFICVHARCL